MTACEKCWADAGGESKAYAKLVSERECTPEEQAGPSAGECLKCGRKTLHQHTGKAMCGCAQAPSSAGGGVVLHTRAEMRAAEKYADGNRNAYMVGEGFLAGIRYEREHAASQLATLTAEVERLRKREAEREEFDRQHSMHVLVPPERYEQLDAATSREAALREALDRLERELRRIAMNSTRPPVYMIRKMHEWVRQALAGKGEKS